MRFEQKVALVTGGTSGIGLAIVRQLATEGAKVVFCGRREELGRQVEVDLHKAGAVVLFVVCDVSSEDQVESLLDHCLKWGGCLDLAVNAAGVSPRRARFVDSKVEDYETVFATNVRGMFLTMKHELLAMESQRSGVIVNIASVLGIKAVDLNHSIYTASKHAVMGLTKTAALECASKGVRINTVCPGGIDTPIHQTNTSTQAARQRMAEMHPLGRLGTPEEVAMAVAFLLSDQAQFITGSILSVDGGAAL